MCPLAAYLKMKTLNSTGWNSRQLLTLGIASVHEAYNFWHFPRQIRRSICQSANPIRPNKTDQDSSSHSIHSSVLMSAHADNADADGLSPSPAANIRCIDAAILAKGTKFWQNSRVGAVASALRCPPTLRPRLRRGERLPQGTLAMRNRETTSLFQLWSRLETQKMIYGSADLVSPCAALPVAARWRLCCRRRERCEA